MRLCNKPTVVILSSNLVNRAKYQTKQKLKESHDIEEKQDKWQSTSPIGHLVCTNI